MKFEIDETAARGRFDAAVARNGGQPLTPDQQRQVADEILRDAALAIVRQFNNWLGTGLHAEAERAEKVYYTFYEPLGKPTRRKDAMGRETVQYPPRAEHKVLVKDLDAFCLHHGLDPEKMKQVALMERLDGYKGWTKGRVWPDQWCLTVNRTLTLAERYRKDPVGLLDILEDMRDRDVEKPHPLSLPVELPTASPAEPVAFDPANPDAPLPFTWQPGEWGPHYPEQDPYAPMGERPGDVAMGSGKQPDPKQPGILGRLLKP